ncbi:MFS transporter [Micromonospora sp. DT62]|uniref:MFS transporter n=1 Tax=Micromonospora sp. DT62 TaxID=3416521 RepID=UPI003CFA382D
MTERYTTAQLLRDPDVRRLCASNLVRTIGTGLVLSVATIYFVTVADIPMVELGAGLTLAAVLAMLASYPTGVLADRFGARTATVAAGIAQGVATASYILATTTVTFIVVACAVAVMEAASTSARGALVSQVLPKSTRAGARGLMRATNNVGLTVGAGLGALVLLHPDRMTFAVGLLAAGLAQCGGALVCLRFPRPVPVAVDHSKPAAVGHRDLPVLALVLLNGVLAMNEGVMFVVLPVWIVSHTSIEQSFFSVLVIVNTVCVVLLQTRFARLGDTVRGARRALSMCAVSLSATCLLFGAAGSSGARWGYVLLLAGALTHVIAEMSLAGGAWGAATGLSPDHVHGQYLGLFSTASQIGRALTPVTALALVSGLQGTGWILLAVLFVATAAAVGPVVALAVRTRSRYFGEVLEMGR